MKEKGRIKNHWREVDKENESEGEVYKEERKKQKG